MHRLVQISAGQMHILPDFQEHAGHARILADGLRPPGSEVCVFENLRQNVLCNGPFLPVIGGLQAGPDVLRQMAVCLHAHTRDGLGQPFT